jgi:hypothetical protein
VRPLTLDLQVADEQKCDAVKPECTNCQRHNHRQANSSKPKPLECTWDAPRRERRKYDDIEDIKLVAKRAKVAELEGKIGKSFSACAD